MTWNCGGTTVQDATGAIRTAYCGGCSGGTYCQSNAATGVGIGTCGGSTPLLYAWQRQKIDALVAMGENDVTVPAYDYAQNINDGRGYTVGKVGFCTGTGDFIDVAQCYNDLSPGNVLSKYWGHRDASGKAIDGLIFYNEAFFTTHMNQGATTLIDSLKGTSTFVKDVATAATDPVFRGCQDTMADALYMATALQHVTERGLKGVLTIGFLYDTELNLGDDDDSPTVLGAKSVMKKADADYGPGLPTDFTSKAWEESKWLGYFIKERAILMASDRTWKKANDQNATWEAARRLHTAASNNPESGTDLSMDYDFVSAYKASATTAGTPCWPTGLASANDSGYTVYTVSTDKSASATDQAKWTIKSSGSPNATQMYKACPANPTP
jgi:chitosanase